MNRCTRTVGPRFGSSRQGAIAIGVLLVAMSGAGRLVAEGPTFVYLSEASEKKIVIYRQEGTTGELKPAGEIATPGEPGPLTTDPERRFLYASMRSTGELASFRIDAATGRLTAISLVPAGADPAYVACDRTGRFLFSAYYAAGKVAVHELSSDGSIGREARQTIDTAKNAHAILADHSGRFVFVPHTGPNRIYQFLWNADEGRLASNDPPFIQTGDRTGPRHLAFHPKLPIVYFDNEQGSSVASYRMDAERGVLTPIETWPTIPADFTEPNSCARLEISPDGRFLFAANRGHDSLAGFAVDSATGKLKPLGQTPTEKTPRSFTIDPSGRFVYAAGQSVDKLAAFRLHDDGRLERFATYPTGHTPWWAMAVRLGR